MDYPIMLYLGGLNSHAIAHDEDEYDALIDSGYVTHAEAMKLEPNRAGVHGSTGDTVGNKVPSDMDDELAEANEHIELLEGAIEVKDKEISDLNGKLEKSDEWNNEVTEQNELHRSTIKELNEEITHLKNNVDDSQEIADLKYKLAVYEETKAVTGNGVTSYDQMTNAELHKLLESRNAEYSKRDDKDTLIQKAKDSE